MCVWVCAGYRHVCTIVCICECICVLGIVHGIENLSPKAQSKSLKVSLFMKITKIFCQADAHSHFQRDVPAVFTELTFA